jgi:hypothetical protein
MIRGAFDNPGQNLCPKGNSEIKRYKATEASGVSFHQNVGRTAKDLLSRASKSDCIWFARNNRFWDLRSNFENLKPLSASKKFGICAWSDLILTLTHKKKNVSFSSLGHMQGTVVVTRCWRENHLNPSDVLACFFVFAFLVPLENSL